MGNDKNSSADGKEIQKIKEILAKEYVIFVIIVIISFVMAYIFFPVWAWDYEAKESLSFFDWRTCKLTFGICYMIRFLILSIAILKKKTA